MVSLGTGYFNPESSSIQGGTAKAVVKHFPIFKHTSPRPHSSVASSRDAGSEADDEATTTVSGPSSSSSSSDPSSKRCGPPVAMVSSRSKRSCPEASTGHSGGETSSLSTNTAPSIVDEEREHFPLFTDEEDCTSIGESRAGESFSSTTCSSPIPWTSINLTHVASNSSTSIFSAYHNRHYPSSPDKEAPLLPTYRHGGSTSSASQAERGRQLARVLLDQARNKPTTKRRRVSFARPVRSASDAASSASTSTSSSFGEKGDHDAIDPYRPSSRHVLSKRNKVRASLLRRAVQSLRRRKDFVDNLFEIPADGEEEKREADDCSNTDSLTYYPAMSAVTARNLSFAEWERYLAVPKAAQSQFSQQQRKWNSSSLPESPLRNSQSCTPQPSPSRISVTSSTMSFFDAVSSMPSSSNGDDDEKGDCNESHVNFKQAMEPPDPNSWLLDGLSGRTDRNSMLDQLGFVPRDKMPNPNDPSKLSREAVLKTLDTLSMVWDQKDEPVKGTEPSLPVLPATVPPPRSPPRHAQQVFGKKPTVSILGVVVVNYPQLVRDQVNHFRRNVLNISDAFYGMWGSAATTTPTTATRFCK